uniref:Uncharacterized protein n=1 Tax=Oryza glaberrima TaxID=4538 RepID=I1QBB3_ORYGL
MKAKCTRCRTTPSSAPPRSGTGGGRDPMGGSAARSTAPPVTSTTRGPAPWPRTRRSASLLRQRQPPSPRSSVHFLNFQVSMFHRSRTTTFPFVKIFFRDFFVMSTVGVDMIFITWPRRIRTFLSILHTR